MKYQISDLSAFESTQVCDGKFYYWIQQLNGERTIEFVDLERLQTGGFDFGSGPSQWLTRAGTASLLRNLSSAFEFDEPTPTELGGHKMLLIKGQWKRKSLASILHGQWDAKDDQPIQWERLPNQLPHSVEVYLGTDDFLYLFPYRLSFFKFDDRGERQESPTLTMELFQVQKLESLPADLFRVNADGSHQVDLSRDYSQHIEHIAEAVGDLNRR